MSVGSGEKAAKAGAKIKTEAERVLGLEATVRDAARPVHLEVLGISCMDSIEDIIVDTKSKYPKEKLSLSLSLEEHRES